MSQPTRSSTRFDYVKYDDASLDKQMAIKAAVLELEALVETLISGREKALALTKLEEAYAWVGKSIKIEQEERDSATEKQERRGNE